ncbi:MAG TPA: peptidase, partial [Hyphomicrobiaceae bacterium]|nr:peptidase [Hyphomicrobiaceae bacterium]
RVALPIPGGDVIGGRPLEAMTLVALGYRSLSMAPASIGPVKAMIRSLDVGAAREVLTSLLRTDARSIRREIADFAAAQGVTI